MSTDQRLDYADPMQIMAALLFLFAEQSRSRSMGLMPLIIQHLELIQQHESASVSLLLRNVCGQLREQWSNLMKSDPQNVQGGAQGSVHGGASGPIPITSRLLH